MSNKLQFTPAKPALARRDLPSDQPVQDKVDVGCEADINIKLIQPSHRSADKRAVILGSAVLGAIGAAAAHVALGPLAGGVIVCAGMAHTRETPGFHPVKVSDADTGFKRALKLTANGLATVGAYTGMFAVGALGGPILAGIYGFSSGRKSGEELVDRLTAAPQVEVELKER